MDRIVHPIAEKEYHELLSTAAEFIDQIMQLNEKALIQFVKSKTTETFEEYHKAALFLWTEAIELLDGIKSLILGSSCNMIPILMRSLFEVSISVQFIYSDSQKIKRRALTYRLIPICKRYDICKKMDIKNPDYQSYRESLGPEIVKLYSSDDTLPEFLSNFDKFMSKSPESRAIFDEYSNMKRKASRGISPEWYELFNECRSIFDMSCKLGWKSLYLILYDSYSKKAHGLSADMAWPQNGFKNPKAPNLKIFGAYLNDTLTYISHIGTNILKFELPSYYSEYCRKYLAIRQSIGTYRIDLQRYSFSEIYAPND